LVFSIRESADNTPHFIQIERESAVIDEVGKPGRRPRNFHRASQNHKLVNVPTLCFRLNSRDEETIDSYLIEG
jgi:hypothetical protein